MVILRNGFENSWTVLTFHSESWMDK